MDHFLSVIIPLYNKEKSILRTINSVLQQTYSNFEIVIVNDGSTDNSLNMVQKINDKRIRIISKKNGGVSSARNVGIKSAKYDYIVFLDADDLWLNDHLKIMNELINNYAEASVFSTGFVNDEKEIDKKNTLGKSYYIVDYFKTASKKTILNSSCVMVEKRCFDIIGFFDEEMKYGEDMHMWLRLASVFIFAKSDTITQIYVQNSENRSGGIVLEYDELLINKLTEIYKKNSCNKYIGIFVKKIIIRETKRLLLLGETKLARSKLKEYRKLFNNSLDFVYFSMLSLFPIKRIYNMIHGKKA